MCKSAAIVFSLLCVFSAAGEATSAPTAKPAPKPKPLISAAEWTKIRQTAVNYSLTDEQTWLLAAIRRQENGRPGLEFGVGGPMNSGHPAHRFQDGYKSFYVQAAWAAGTVKKHYKGDLPAFGRRYNPLHAAKWSANVASLIRRLKAENGNMLPGTKPEKRVFDFM